jgi:hypothetical protein
MVLTSIFPGARSEKRDNTLWGRWLTIFVNQKNLLKMALNLCVIVLSAVNRKCPIAGLERPIAGLGFFESHVV